MTNEEKKAKVADLEEKIRVEQGLQASRPADAEKHTKLIVAHQQEIERVMAEPEDP